MANDFFKGTAEATLPAVTMRHTMAYTYLRIGRVKITKSSQNNLKKKKDSKQK